jgi:hypothetical protein
MTAVPSSDQGQPATACWCCGTLTGEEGVVRLGDHPEVAVCLGCAHYLRRRACERVASPLGRRLHRAGATVRDAVMHRGWHEAPILGPLLRRIDRHLPW